MTPTQLRLSNERRERLARFERAGLQYRTDATAARVMSYREPVAARPNKYVPPVVEPVRRQYDIPQRLSANMPIARRIISVVAHEFNITPDEMIGPRRGAPLPLARFVAVGLFLELTQLSFPAIGRRLNRDHTTILSARDQFHKLTASEAFRNRFDQLKELVR